MITNYIYIYDYNRTDVKKKARIPFSNGFAYLELVVSGVCKHFSISSAISSDPGDQEHDR
jgi:transglutaminase-like putative cysteine protease